MGCCHGKEDVGSQDRHIAQLQQDHGKGHRSVSNVRKASTRLSLRKSGATDDGHVSNNPLHERLSNASALSADYESTASESEEVTASESEDENPVFEQAETAAPKSSQAGRFRHKHRQKQSDRAKRMQMIKLHQKSFDPIQVHGGGAVGLREAKQTRSVLSKKAASKVDSLANRNGEPLSQDLCATEIGSDHDAN